MKKLLENLFLEGYVQDGETARLCVTDSLSGSRVGRLAFKDNDWEADDECGENDLPLYKVALRKAREQYPDGKPRKVISSMSYKYIFQVEVRPGEDRAFIQSWHNGSIPIQQSPGALGTRLHKKRGEEHVYIAIAEWESREARQAAMEKLHTPGDTLGDEMRRWGRNEDFGTVRLLAEVDEIDLVNASTTDLL
jgi:quinol monooxygenase YgiN